MAKKPVAATKKSAKKGSKPKAAKAPKVPKNWQGAQRDANIDSMYGQMRETAKRELGRDDVTVSAESESRLVGLPLPSLAARFLFQSTVWPLSRIIQFAGPEGSCKTALLSELYRWHCVYGGGGVHCENENKDAAVLRNSILQYNPLWLSRINVIPTESLEEWQKALTLNVFGFKALLDVEGGPGRTVPLCMGVDSLTSTDTKRLIAQTAKDGYASLGYAEQANLISRYMRQFIVGALRGYPFTVAGTNHIKAAMSQGPVIPGQPPKKNIPGGKAVPFMATFLCETERIKDISTKAYDGIRIKIKATKCSIGASRKAIELEMLWWWQHDGPGGEPRQHHVWDWDAAAIELLLKYATMKNKQYMHDALMGVVDLHPSSGKKVWSQALGIPSGKPIDYRAAGALLEQRVDLLEQLYPILGIAKNYYFQPGLDYRTMELEAQERGAREAASLYQNVEEMPALDPHALDPENTSLTEDDDGAVDPESLQLMGTSDVDE